MKPLNTLWLIVLRFLKKEMCRLLVDMLWFESPEVSVVSFSLPRYQRAAEETSAEKKKGVSIFIKLIEQDARNIYFPSGISLHTSLT